MRSRIIAGAVNVYGTYAVNPGVFRITMKMKDPVNEKVLKLTLATTIKRYPYLKVRKLIENEEIFFEENDAPISVIHTKDFVEPGGSEACGHLMVLSWWENCISVNVHPALTDETGIYQFIKSFLYYYSSKYYSCSFSSCRIRFTGTDIPEDEWKDPLEEINGTVTSSGIIYFGETVYNLPEGSGSAGKCSLRCIRVPEKEYLDFAVSIGCKPDTAAALLLARAISVNKSSGNNTVIALAADMRRSLGATSAHQPLQCFMKLLMTDEQAKLNIKEQAEEIEAFIKQQKSHEALREQAGHIKAVVDRIMEKTTLDEKRRYASDLLNDIATSVTASVNYRGMADYDDAEQFVKAFFVEASPLRAPLHLSLCDMNGSFYFNVFQTFEEGKYFNALVKEIESAGLHAEVLERL